MTKAEREQLQGLARDRMVALSLEVLELAMIGQVPRELGKQALEALQLYEESERQEEYLPSEIAEHAEGSRREDEEPDINDEPPSDYDPDYGVVKEPRE